jgi:hypothetical protein
MGHIIRLVSNVQLTDPVISDSIGYAISWGAFEFGMAETERLFRILCGDLR